LSDCRQKYYAEKNTLEGGVVLHMFTVACAELYKLDRSIIRLV
jgi:hypothetical protein